MKHLFLFFFAFQFVLGISQDNGLIRGYVFDQNSGEPIINAYLNIESINKATATDKEGFFIINNLKAGSYSISISYLGFNTLTTSFELKKNEILFKNFNLEEGSIELGVVNISAAKEISRSEVQISKISVTPKEILRMPSIGGEADIAQYLQVIPGIISTGDQGGQIYIRGGSPIQNKILLDGLTIFNPFHSIGFFSVFETEMVRNVDVYTGGFSAEYGGRISAIVDINTREGNKKRLGGQLAANPFLWKAFLEGPIIKWKENGGSTSFIFSSKNSIIDQTSKRLYPKAAYNDTIGLPFKFQDLYGKLSFINENGSKLNLFGFNFKDSYNNPDIANLNWVNAGGGADFRLIPGNSNFILNGMIGYTDYSTHLNESDGSPRESRIKNFTTLIDFNFFGKNSELNYGIEFNSFNTDFQFQNPFNIILGQSQNTTEIGAFAKYRYVLGKLILEPSFRLQYYASLSQFSPEPRIGLKWNLNDFVRLKLAAGLYSQNLLAASNEKDVVNLFTGFLSGPEERIFELGTSEIAAKNIQTAKHLILGVEFELDEHFSFNVETYYKDFNQLIIVNRNKLLPSDPNFSTEIGEAYGFDISSNYKLHAFSLKVNYALGYVFRYDGRQTYPPVFDRRHNINILSNYEFGNSKNWSVGLRWNMGSGFPFTRTQGFYNFNPFQDGLGTNYVQDNPEVIGIIYEEARNAGRLPYYHRMDMNLTKTIEITKNQNLVIDGSITNIYNRQNIFYFNRLTYDRVNQLPLLASIGIKLNF